MTPTSEKSERLRRQQVRHHGADKSRPCAVARSPMLGGARYVRDTVTNAHEGAVDEEDQPRTLG